MARPQQPELQRSGHNDATPDHAAETAGTTDRSRPQGERSGPIPPANQPGHHDAVDQDKPTGPPPAPAPAPDPDRPGWQRFAFEFQTQLLPVAAAFGVLPSTAYVEVDDEELLIRFGLWSLRTPVSNVAGTEPTGPYRWWKVAGPPHLSLADRGVTFATTTRAGLCIRFHEPVPAALPRGLMRHPAATVTVAEPHALAAALS